MAIVPSPMSERGKVRVMSRGSQDYSQRFPELQGLAANARRPLVLDGEIIAPGEDEGSSFQRLQSRNASVGSQPIAYMIFDLLRLNGRSTTSLTYVDRRSRLDDLGLHGDAWSVPPYQVGGGRKLLEQSRSLHMEGIMAKRLASIYVPGGRTGDWLKVKNHARQEFVIVGSTPGQGARSGQIGALLLAYHDRAGPGGKLVYAGKVGTGFNSQSLELLAERMRHLMSPTSPLDLGKPPRDASFVEPQLVAEVEFTEWTREGTLRHPSFKGLRDDKKAREVVRETESPPPPPTVSGSRS